MTSGSEGHTRKNNHRTRTRSAGRHTVPNTQVEAIFFFHRGRGYFPSEGKLNSEDLVVYWIINNEHLQLCSPLSADAILTSGIKPWLRDHMKIDGSTHAMSCPNEGGIEVAVSIFIWICYYDVEVTIPSDVWGWIDVTVSRIKRRGAKIDRTVAVFQYEIFRRSTVARDRVSCFDLEAQVIASIAFDNTGERGRELYWRCHPEP